MEDNFGTPHYGPKKKDERTKRPVPHKLSNKNPVEVVRIIPPVKSGKKTGQWKRFVRVHWGYNVALQKDASKTYKMNFYCPKTFSKSADCAMCDEISKKETAYEALVTKCTSEGKSPEQTETITAPLKGWLDDFNCDGKWYINVMNQKGEFYPLMLNSTTNATLDREMAKLIGPDTSRPKIDPLDLSKGVWFRFEFLEGGKSNSVDIVQESIELPNGIEAYTNKPAPLTDDQRAEASTLCPDLNTEISRLLPSEKIRMLVNSSGDPEEVAKIVDLTEKTTKPEDSEEGFFDQFRS